MNPAASAAPDFTPPAVFITGASSGIGAALARQYAAQGAVVGLVGRRLAALQAVVAEMAQPVKGEHRCYAVDVCDFAAVKNAAEDFITRYGAPDVVIAAAGISQGTWTEYAEDLPHFRAVFETNVLAMPNTFHPFIAPMKTRGRGTLVGIASVAGIRGLPGSEAYCASKAAVISYCESLRGELRASGVRVLTIAPGYVATPLTAHNPYKMPFLMQPDDFAAHAVRAIARQTSYTVIPWQMGVVAKLLRLLPNFLFDRLFANKQYKPRATDNPSAPNDGDAPTQTLSHPAEPAT